MTDTNRKIGFHLMITEEQMELLNEKAEITNKSKAELVREAINEKYKEGAD